MGASSPAVVVVQGIRQMRGQGLRPVKRTSSAAAKAVIRDKSYWHLVGPAGADSFPAPAKDPLVETGKAPPSKWGIYLGHEGRLKSAACFQRAADTATCRHMDRRYS